MTQKEEICSNNYRTFKTIFFAGSWHRTISWPSLSMRVSKTTNEIAAKLPTFSAEVLTISIFTDLFVNCQVKVREILRGTILQQNDRNKEFNFY
jgi:hypothetical protein